MVLASLWLLGVVAAAGPSWQQTPLPFSDPPGLVIVLKASSSMTAKDVQPSRLIRSRQKLADLLAQRQGDPTGLIVYSGSAHLVMPLTKDPAIIPLMLEELSPDLMPVEGDALLEGLSAAETLLRQSGRAGSILLVADTVAEAQVEALKARQPAVPVHVLSIQGVGSDADRGITAAASALGSTVERLTADSTDIERIARRIAGNTTAVSWDRDNSRSEDGGYFLLPLIAVLAMFWARRGWTLR
jgi:Ca-activated chloride channel family protein